MPFRLTVITDQQWALPERWRGPVHSDESLRMPPRSSMLDVSGSANPRPVLTRRWGGSFGPPAVCQITGPILDPKTAFDSSGLGLPEYVAKFYLNVTEDVTGRVKGQFLDYLSLLASRGKAAISP